VPEARASQPVARAKQPVVLEARPAVRADVAQELMQKLVAQAYQWSKKAARTALAAQPLPSAG